MSDAAAAWTALTAHMTEARTLSSLAGVLGWDQQTMMPPAGGALRGEQQALVSRLVHERMVDPRVGEWLGMLEGAELTDVQQGGVRNIRRAYDRAVRLPSDLVERLARAEAAGFEAWVSAKEASDFAAFAPTLQSLLDLTREKAAAVDPDRHPYDVLLDDFDPGVTVDQLRPMFARLREGLVALIDAVRDVDGPAAITEAFDVAGQERLHRALLPTLGYDMKAGRLDTAEHPFTVGFGRGDVRITTHLYERDLLSGLGGTVHEAGHGMYEQGLPYDLWGTGVCEAASLGLHESQSRFWENTIGRSRAFFDWFAGELRKEFPGTSVSADDLYGAANRIEPGLIRVFADEVTYNLHIIVRFELELALLEGRLAVADLPEAWNERYREYLGITPPDDARGVLQDVHWSGGAFGYFPSYTLGNLYAASFGVAIERDVPDLWEQVAQGEFSAVLGWLRDNVHRKGHLLDAPEIVRGVVGERDHVEDLLAYLWGRHGKVYGVTRP